MDMTLGSLLAISPTDSNGHTDTSIALDYTTNPSYYTRVRDTLVHKTHGKITRETINRIINHNPKDVLTNSPITKLPLILFDVVMHMRRAAADGPTNTVPLFCVNVFPVRFTPEENEVFKQSLKSVFLDLVDVQVESYDPRTLLPSYVLLNYAFLFFYDFSWVEAHSEELKKTAPNPGLRFFFPKIMHTDSDDASALLTLKQNNAEAFGRFMAVMRALIPIDFLPISLYCAQTPVNLREYDTYMPSSEFGHIAEQTLGKDIKAS